MAIRISVSLPDDLHERLNAVKDHFNVSKTCQESIEKKVSILEVRQKKTDNETLMERFRLEREQFDEEIRQEGVLAGISDIESMAYRDMRAFSQDRIPDWLDDFLREQYFDETDEYRGKEDVFKDGWIEGIKQAWAEVEPFIEKN